MATAEHYTFPDNAHGLGTCLGMCSASPCIRLQDTPCHKVMERQICSPYRRSCATRKAYSQGKGTLWSLTTRLSKLKRSLLWHG